MRHFLLLKSEELNSLKDIEFSFFFFFFYIITESIRGAAGSVQRSKEKSTTDKSDMEIVPRPQSPTATDRVRQKEKNKILVGPLVITISSDDRVESLGNRRCTFYLTLYPSK